MKLGGKEVVFLDGSGNFHSVLCSGGYDLVVLRPGVVGVHKVEHIAI